MMTDARGKVGGQVFSKNRGGAYVRTKVSPINPQTAAQTTARAALAGFSAGWRALTAAQRLAWNNAVQDFQTTDVFGDIKTPSGIDLYIRINCNLAKIGVAAISTPPLPTNVPPLTGLALVADVSDASFEISATEATAGANIKLYVEATPCLSPGKSFVKSEFRAIDASAANVALPYDVGTEWLAKFGVLTAGQKVFARVRSVSTTTGLESLPQVISAIVTA